ncbi:MAG: hypothetical protein ABI298_04580 [Acidimicrobiales bacterium]
MSQTSHYRGRSAVSFAITAVVSVVVALVVGTVSAHLVAPSVHSHYFLWISGRALGLSAFTALWLLVLVGSWMRHPWRSRFRAGHPETRLRLHSALAAATVALVTGHVSTLAMDRYAGVGWKGVIIPGASTYRPAAVTIGIIGLITMLAMTASAALAGRRGTRHWLLVHRLGALNFAVVWLHGVLAGTDTAALRLFYLVTGSTWIAMVATRLGARPDAVSFPLTSQPSNASGPTTKSPRRSKVPR